LLFPDGSLQHAGVAIVDDQVHGFFEGRHRWYGDPSDLPDANVAGVVQAVTAAAMLVRRTAFDEVGGFDEGYWNGNEDLDLCFKLAAAGWTTVYQPASCVVHHESVSGPERWRKCTENMNRLRARWYGRITPDVLLTP
jgi:GT2 family glycosyltransferase